MKTIIVIGAGPAGFAASYAAATSGARVILLESSSQPGRKLRASGGGRCNLTNMLPIRTMTGLYHSASPSTDPSRFVRPALKAFDQRALIDFLHKRGVATETEQQLLVYPRSRKATDVVNAWHDVCLKAGVDIKMGHRVTSLRFDNTTVTGVNTDNSRLDCDKLIIAAGGKGYPALGATSDGYRLARKSGHHISTPLPGLAPLELADNWILSCAGVTLPDIQLSVKLESGRAESFRGSILITHTGISGPAAINSSTVISRLLHNFKKPVSIELAISPAADSFEWKNRFIMWQQKQGNKRILSLLSQFIPRSIASAILKRLRLPEDINAAELRKAARKDLVTMVTALPLKVKATGNFDKAMVTAGGVSLDDIEPKTLGSRVVGNLFFCGEVVDIDGPCGGFNLQWAFSSGHLAGLSAAAK